MQDLENIVLFDRIPCPECHKPMGELREDPRGIKLPYCCGVFWVPRWKLTNGQIHIHLMYYRPEGMAYEKGIIHENEIQEAVNPPESLGKTIIPDDLNHNEEFRKQFCEAYVNRFGDTGSEHLDKAYDLLVAVYLNHTLDEMVRFGILRHIPPDEYQLINPEVSEQECPHHQEFKHNKKDMFLEDFFDNFQKHELELFDFESHQL